MVGLQAADYRVECAENGKSLLRRLCRSDIDLGIVDIVIDERDDFEILCELRKANSGVPLIAISGTNQYIEISERFGCYQTLLKPFTLPQLVTAV